MLDWSSHVQAFVQAHRVARLATVDGAGCPLVLPICYTVAEETVYSPIDAKPKRVAVQRLKRLRNIQENPHVALVIDDYAEDWAQLAHVILHGRAEIITGGSPFERAVAALRIKYSQYQQMPIEENPMIAVHLTHVVRWGAVG